MWLRRTIILVSILVLLGAWFVVNSHQTNADVDRIGRKLADWSHHHQKTIKINGKPINLAGGIDWAYGVEQTSNGPQHFCKGTTAVYWQTSLAAEEDNRTLRENLRSVVQHSRCSRQALLTYLDKLDNFDELMQITAERLEEDLAGLGKFEFISVEIK